MLVRVDHDGHFDVRFRMEAPHTQITLRMELKVMRDKRPEGKIILPPIRIQPERLDDPDTSSQSVLVEYAGTSELLRRLGKQVLKQVEEQTLPQANAARAAAQESQTEVDKQLEAALEKQEAAESEQVEADRNWWQLAPEPHWKPNLKGLHGPIPKGAGPRPMPAQALEAQRKAADVRLNQAEADLKKADEQLRHWEAAKAMADATLAHADMEVVAATNVKVWSLADHAGITFSREGTTRFGGVPR